MKYDILILFIFINLVIIISCQSAVVKNDIVEFVKMDLKEILKINIDLNKVDYDYFEIILKIKNISQEIYLIPKFKEYPLEINPILIKNGKRIFREEIFIKNIYKINEKDIIFTELAPGEIIEQVVNLNIIFGRNVLDKSTNKNYYSLIIKYNLGYGKIYGNINLREKIDKMKNVLIGWIDSNEIKFEF